MPKKQQHNLNLWLVPVLGRSSAGPRPDPYRGEAVPLPHLWHPLPPSADPEEPPAHSHRREALHCESKAQMILIILLLAACLTRWTFFSVRSVTFTSATRASCVCTCARNTGPSPTPRSATRSWPSPTSPFCRPAEASRITTSVLLRIISELVRKCEFDELINLYEAIIYNFLQTGWTSHWACWILVSITKVLWLFWGRHDVKKVLLKVCERRERREQHVVRILGMCWRTEYVKNLNER